MAPSAVSSSYDSNRCRVSQKLKSLCGCEACKEPDLRASADRYAASAAKQKEERLEELDAVRRSSEKGSERGSVTAQLDLGSKLDDAVAALAAQIAAPSTATRSVAPAPAAAPSPADWQLVPEDATGRSYWWNSATDEVSWSAPPGVEAPEEMLAQVDDFLEESIDLEEEGGCAPLWSMDGELRPVGASMDGELRRKLQEAEAERRQEVRAATLRAHLQPPRPKPRGLTQGPTPHPRS